MAYTFLALIACETATSTNTFGPPGGENSSSGDNTMNGSLGNDDGLRFDAGMTEGSTPNLCGNGVKNSETETCDDGNMANNDGCSSNCRIEDGWSCPVAGARCIAKQCGDGILAGDEECDDGANNSADSGVHGCTAACRLVEGFKCPTPGAPCVPTTCGDGIKEGAEQCDDHNNDPFDGCDPACHVEPVCANGSCTSACGDGLKFPGEACDDGNRHGGDGCNAGCVLEPGYTCTNAQGMSPTFKDLYIVYRDFMGAAQVGGHPDFEVPFWSTNPANFDVISAGLVQSTLNMAGRPVFASRRGTGNYDIIQDATTFAAWYTDTAYSKKTVTKMRLDRQGAGPYTYLFDSTAFFPIDPLTPTTWPQRDSGHNFHFTSELRIPFTYKGGESLTFRGDDDVWVFVNGKLAVDLGGVKNARSGTIVLGDVAAFAGNTCSGAALATVTPSTVCGTLSNTTIAGSIKRGDTCTNITDASLQATCTTFKPVDLGLTVNGMYEFVVFQAERHVTGSNYQLTLTDFDRFQTSCTSVCGDGIKTPDEACDSGTALNDGQYGHCSSNCQSRGEYCGDGIVQSAHEECDSTIGCSPDCRTSDHAPR